MKHWHRYLKASRPVSYSLFVGWPIFC